MDSREDSTTAEITVQFSYSTAYKALRKVRIMNAKPSEREVLDVVI